MEVFWNETNCTQINMRLNLLNLLIKLHIVLTPLFGEIIIYESVFIESGKLIRPFSYEVKVKSRGYSTPSERRITDFGADDSFKKAGEKLKEHYGITVPESSVRLITEKHAEIIKKEKVIESEIPDNEGAAYIISGMDGTMIPIVDTEGKDIDKKPTDRRKTRKVRWKEARLTLAYELGTVQPIFGVTTGSPENAGDLLADCAIQAGIGSNTHVCCISDRAVWINDQVDRVFGTQAEYLTDFYHLCDYMAPASKKCAPEAPGQWFDEQKRRMKAGLAEEVLQVSKSCLEPAELPDTEAPVRCCYRYMTDRPEQFNYKDALENKLPIGSGEVESAHRYVIQERLKIPGAWQVENNAENMLFLRVLRENNGWDDYWTKKYQHAA